jgi:hypothetical protein
MIYVLSKIANNIITYYILSLLLLTLPSQTNSTPRERERERERERKRERDHVACSLDLCVIICRSLFVRLSVFSYIYGGPGGSVS